MKLYHIRFKIDGEIKYLLHFDIITKEVTFTTSLIESQCYLGIETLMVELSELLTLESLDNVTEYSIVIE